MLVVLALLRVWPVDFYFFAWSHVRILRSAPSFRSPSGPLALSVGGQPALAVEYGVREKGEESHFRQVFVRYRGWVYYIRETWPPKQASTAQSGFEELLNNWQWQ